MGARAHLALILSSAGLREADLRKTGNIFSLPPLLDTHPGWVMTSHKVGRGGAALHIRGVNWGGFLPASSQEEGGPIHCTPIYTWSQFETTGRTNEFEKRRGSDSAADLVRQGALATL